MADEPTGQEKFDTCHHRTLGEVEIGQEGCCGENNLRMGYFCWETGKEDLTPSDCVGCEKYLERLTL